MARDIFEEIARLRRQRFPAALATVVSTKGSTPAKVPARMIVRADGTLFGTVGGGCVEADVIRGARDVIDTGIPKLLHFRLSGEEAERTGIACGGMLDVMVETLEEPWTIIVGAGHVGQSVAQLAGKVGFRVCVVDDRPDFANKERFPGADEVRVVGKLDDLSSTLTVGRQSYVLIMTRGHAEDFGVLKWALRTPARYVGVLGSRAKRIRFLEDLMLGGFAAEEVEHFRMPIGVNVGAETVDEIAVSIVAELIAERRGVSVPHG